MAKRRSKTRETRADAAEVARRVEVVFRLILDGATYLDIRDYQLASEKPPWNANERTIREYMRRAKTMMIEQQDKERRVAIGVHLAKRQALFARAVNAADYRTALAILDSEAKLRGLYPEKELRDLVKLAAAQGLRIAELEQRLNDEFAGKTPPPVDATSPAA